MFKDTRYTKLTQDIASLVNDIRSKPALSPQLAEAAKEVSEKIIEKRVEGIGLPENETSMMRKAMLEAARGTKLDSTTCSNFENAVKEALAAGVKKANSDANDAEKKKLKAKHAKEMHDMNQKHGAEDYHDRAHAATYGGVSRNNERESNQTAERKRLAARHDAERSKIAAKHSGR